VPRERNQIIKGATVTAADSLMLDAKQAIMDEHHRRFQNLLQEGRWGEALHEIPVTLSCATDLLNEAVQILDEALTTHNRPLTDHSTYPPTTHRERGLS
jgi:cellobiose-specific phosphotransferase system component IIA